MFAIIDSEGAMARGGTYMSMSNNHGANVSNGLMVRREKKQNDSQTI